jgi:predicted nucleic acid-binding protein
MILNPGSRFSAVLDACVLAPMPLCDTLLRRAEEPALFNPLWSSETLEEVRRTLDKFGYTEMQTDRRLRAMEAAFPEASVHLSPRHLKASPELPDPKDKHVLAAAIRKHASTIVTFNLKHFPRSVLEPSGIVASSPGEFLISLLRRDRAQMLKVLDAQARAVGQSRPDVLEKLKSAVPAFVKAVETKSRQN